MQVEVCPTPMAAATRAATVIAEGLRAAITERGRGSVALSGGQTPLDMLGMLAAAPLDWSRLHIFQVDERLVGEDDERRNLRTLRSAFERADVRSCHLHGMPVDADAPELAIAAYVRELRAAAGAPPMLDVVHLGLGADGHTASLVPGDRAVDAAGDVALSGRYMGVQRMTLTVSALNRARLRLWLVTGASKREVVRRLLGRDPELVASRIRPDASILVLDRDASVSPE